MLKDIDILKKFEKVKKCKKIKKLFVKIKSENLKLILNLLTTTCVPLIELKII